MYLVQGFEALNFFRHRLDLCLFGLAFFEDFAVHCRIRQKAGCVDDPIELKPNIPPDPPQTPRKTPLLAATQGKDRPPSTNIIPGDVPR